MVTGALIEVYPNISVSKVKVPAVAKPEFLSEQTFEGVFGRVIQSASPGFGAKFEEYITTFCVRLKWLLCQKD